MAPWRSDHLRRRETQHPSAGTGDAHAALGVALRQCLPLLRVLRALGTTPFGVALGFRVEPAGFIQQLGAHMRIRRVVALRCIGKPRNAHLYIRREIEVQVFDDVRLPLAGAQIVREPLPLKAVTDDELIMQLPFFIYDNAAFVTQK